jgi:hypothetical protein
MRRLFLVFSALAYGLLGGGPSLWALGLAQPKPAACSAMGCSCPVGGEHKGGKQCCCRMGQKLSQKLAKLAQAEAAAELAAPAGSCQLRSLPCGPTQDVNGQSLPVQRPHVLAPAAVLPLPLALDGGLLSLSALLFEAELLPPDQPPRP